MMSNRCLFKYKLKMLTTKTQYNTKHHLTNSTHHNRKENNNNPRGKVIRKNKLIEKKNTVTTKTINFHFNFSIVFLSHIIFNIKLFEVFLFMPPLTANYLNKFNV